MWLKYGISPQGDLIGIDEVARGKTHLVCLYCGCNLTAKKGAVKEHHFAHTGETCRPVTQRMKTKAFPALPLYDCFNIQLSGQELQALKVLWKEYGIPRYPIPKSLINFRLILRGLLAETSENLPGHYEFTPLGKIPVGALPLAQFNQVQEPLLLEELAKYERSAELAQVASFSCRDERLADLQIYRAQLRRILQKSLYLLEIKVDDRAFYKIGITQRSIEERLVEIERDLSEYYPSFIINLLGFWEHRGNVELYFKHRYKAFNYPIGSLTEYFQFPQVKAILNDLHKMEPKVLSEAEVAVLRGSESSAIAPV